MEDEFEMSMTLMFEEEINDNEEKMDIKEAEEDDNEEDNQIDEFVEGLVPYPPQRMRRENALPQILDQNNLMVPDTNWVNFMNNAINNIQNNNIQDNTTINNTTINNNNTIEPNILIY